MHEPTDLPEGAHRQATRNSTRVASGCRRRGAEFCCPGKDTAFSTSKGRIPSRKALELEGLRRRRKELFLRWGGRSAELFLHATCPGSGKNAPLHNAPGNPRFPQRCLRFSQGRTTSRAHGTAFGSIQSLQPTTEVSANTHAYVLRKPQAGFQAKFAVSHAAASRPHSSGGDSDRPGGVAEERPASGASTPSLRAAR